MNPTGHATARAVFQMLSHVEERAGSGMLIYGRRDGSAAGAMVVSGGRLCLVRGVEGVPRFTKLLAQRHPESSRLLEGAVQSARAQGRMIGEILAEIGQLALSQIRDCLRDQVAACVVALGATVDNQADPRWENLAGSFDQRLTFSPREMFRVTTEQLELGRAPDFACYVHAEYRAEAEFSVLGLREEQMVLPVQLDGLDAPELRQLRILGQHVRAVAAPATLQAAGIEPRMVSFNTGKHYGLVCVGESFVALLGGLSPGARAKIMGAAAARLRDHRDHRDHPDHIEAK